MKTLSIKKIEDLLNIKIKRNITILGLDLATRTGWCLLQTDKDNIYLEYNVINIQTKDKNERYYYMTQIFNELIKQNYQIVIEDTFLKWNPDAFKFLSRLGGIVYAICYFKKVKYPPLWIYASSARKQLNIKGNSKKDEVAKLLRRIGIKIEDEDICDAIVLALVGALIKTSSTL